MAFDLTWGNRFICGFMISSLKCSEVWWIKEVRENLTEAFAQSLKPWISCKHFSFIPDNKLFIIMLTQFYILKLSISLWISASSLGSIVSAEYGIAVNNNNWIKGTPFLFASETVSDHEIREIIPDKQKLFDILGEKW